MDMKLFSKIASLLCCAALLFCCASCATVDEGVPNGMKIATAEDADFRLYVPSVWNVNTAYGISGAYYNLSKQSTVSVVKYPITEEMTASMTEADIAEGGARLDWFWETECKSAVEAYALGGSLSVVEDEPAEESAGVTLDTLNAHKYHLKATVKGDTVHFVHVIAEKDGSFYVFSFTVLDELYESLLEHVNSMLVNFVFAEPYVAPDYVKSLDKDAEAPEGMILASNDDVAYRFYVPDDWAVNQNEAIFAASLKSDGSNVSVVPYMPETDSMSVAEYFALCEEMMKNTAEKDGYELLKTETDVDLGGRLATAYTYTYTIGKTEFQYMQVIAAYKTMIYSVTYTALPENFDAHLEDVNQMIDAFEFR